MCKIKPKLFDLGLPGPVKPGDFCHFQPHLLLVSPSVWPHQPSFCSSHMPTFPAAVPALGLPGALWPLPLTLQVHLQCHLLGVTLS